MGNLTHTVSGDIASFRSAARVPIESLKCHFKPKQDLHGYDRPWPAGGGNNIWDEEWEVGSFNTTTGENIDSLQIRSKNYISVIPNTEYRFVGPTSIWIIPFDENKNVLQGQYFENAVATSGNSSTFNSNSIFIIPNNCYFIKFYLLVTYGITYNNDIAINYPSSITTYSPYENICPIEGWNNIEIVKGHKNLLNLLEYNYKYSTITIDLVKGELSCSRIEGGSATHMKFSLIYKPGTYTLSGQVTGAGCSGLRLLCSSNITGSTWNNYYNMYWKDFINGAITFTLTEDATIGIVFKTGTAYEPATASELLLVYGTQVSNFEPYQVLETIPITFPIIGKNKFNWDVEFVNPDITATTSASKRIFLPYTYCVGGSYSNYFMPIAVESYSIENGIISVKRTPGYSVYGVSYALPLISGQTYYLSCTAVSGFIHTAFYDKEGNYLTGSSNNYSNFSFTVPNNSTISVFNFIPSNTTDIATFSNILIELGNTATEHTDFSSNNTVYGGYVDIAKDEIVAAYLLSTLNGTEEKWTIDGSMSTYRRAFIDTEKLGAIAKAKGMLYCSYCTTKNSRLWYGWISSSGSLSSCHILFYIPVDYDTVDKWKAYLNNNPLSICYELNEPIHYPLSKTELKTFLDQNNIWSNTNDIIEVSYLIHDSNMIQNSKHQLYSYFNQMLKEWHRTYFSCVADGSVHNSNILIPSTNVSFLVEIGAQTDGNINTAMYIDTSLTNNTNRYLQLAFYNNYYYADCGGLRFSSAIGNFGDPPRRFAVSVFSDGTYIKYIDNLKATGTVKSYDGLLNIGTLRGNGLKSNKGHTIQCYVYRETPLTDEQLLAYITNGTIPQ